MQILDKVMPALFVIAVLFSLSGPILNSLMAQRTSHLIVNYSFKQRLDEIRIVERVSRNPVIADEVLVVLTETATQQIVSEMQTSLIKPGRYQIATPSCPSGYEVCVLSVRISIDGRVETVRFPIIYKSDPIFIGPENFTP